MDVGALTLDVTSFILSENHDGDITYAFPFAKVDSLGVVVLHKHRIEKIINYVEDQLFSFINCDDTCALIPNNITSYANEVSSAANNIFCDDEFINDACYVLCRVIAQTKKKDPNSSYWDEGLKIFLCGGGRNIDIYAKELIGKAQTRLRAIGLKALTREDVPLPEKLEAPDLPASQFYRLAVAHGLSFPPYLIGDVYPPSAVDIIDPSNKDFILHDRFISKELT